VVLSKEVAASKRVSSTRFDGKQHTGGCGGGNSRSSSSSPTFLEWTLDQFGCAGVSNIDIDHDGDCRNPNSFLDCVAYDSSAFCSRGASSRQDLDVNDSTSITESVLYDTRRSLYRRTMMTAATFNGEGEDPTNAGGDEGGMMTGSSAPSNNDATATTTPQQHFQKSLGMARGLADDASRAIGNLLPTASLQSITTRKYTLPDKTVASQVLMYRQLLHTKCRPGLKLSRPYQETPAQKAVMHMPWWSEVSIVTLILIHFMYSLLFFCE
jgi:hypothetical protein